MTTSFFSGYVWSGVTPRSLLKHPIEALFGGGLVGFITYCFVKCIDKFTGYFISASPRPMIIASLFGICFYHRLCKNVNETKK